MCVVGQGRQGGAKVLHVLGVTSFIRSPETGRLHLDKGLGVAFCNPWVQHPNSCSAWSPAEQQSTHMSWVLEVSGAGTPSRAGPGWQNQSQGLSGVAFFESEGAGHFPRLSHHGSSSKCGLILVTE
jgi:hypothetical protein